ncbi:MAG: SBBP repeat-containing protein [Chitinophagales bacterium]
MKHLFTLLMLFIFSVTHSQVAPLWINSQMGSGDNSDRYNAIVTDASGNLYLGGYTFNPFQDKDYLIVKMNSAGDTIWTRQFNGASNGADKILYMAIDGSSNIYVTGQSDGGSATQNDIMTRAYNSSGTLKWSATYNNTTANQDDEPNGIAVDNSGNVFITGSTDRDSTATLNDDLITIKYNSNGVQQWAAQINGTGKGTDRGNGIVTDNSGGCVVTGRTATTVDDDVITIKYGSTGSETWRTVYNRGFGNDRGQDIMLDGSGNLYVTGRSENSSDYDVMTIKYNSSGVAQWTKFYNGTNDDFGSYIKADASGNVYVTGKTDFGNHFDIVTVKYNSTGIQQWAKTFGNAALNDEDPSAILVDASGNVYVTGKSDVNATAAIIANNFITLKYNSSGTLQWSVYFDGTATNSDDIAEGIVLDATATNLYVAGGSQNTVTQKDATAVKYSTATGSAVWTKSFNGEGDFTDKVQGMIIDSKKNIYVTGYMINPEVRRDLFVAKINSSGITKWVVTYDFSQQDDEGRSITLDTSGNIYVCGSSVGNGTSDDYVTMKLDSAGNILWTSRYDFNFENDVATAISVNKFNGNVFVTGYSDQNISSKVTNYDIATLKYSSIGNQLSVVRYNGSGNGIDRAADMAIFPTALASSTYIVVTGRTWNGSNYDILTLKYNASLIQKWATAYAGNKDDEARDLFLESSTGDAYVTGNTGTSTHGFDIIALKYNSNGVQQWKSTYNGDGNINDIGYGILTTSKGTYVTGRAAVSGGVDTADVVTIRYNKLSGNQQWVARYDGSGNGLDRGFAIAADQFENIYVTGESNEASSRQDMITLGLDDNGRIRWTGKYDGGKNEDDVARVIAVDKTGYVYAGGYSTENSSTGFNATTLKYCPPPPVNAGSDVSICKKSNVQLNATGGTNYTWTPAAGLTSNTIPNPIASPAATTSYIVTVDNGLGCSGKDTVVVTVNPLPGVNVTANGSLSFCQGDSVILSVQSCTCSYQWKKGSNNIAGATKNSFTAKAKGTYKVVVTNNFGCSKTSKGSKVTILCKNSEAMTTEVNALMVTASPNPTNSFVNIQWESDLNEGVNIIVYDVLGITIYSAIDLQSNSLQFGTELPAGMYFVHVIQGTEEKIIKVIKQN